MTLSKKSATFWDHALSGEKILIGLPGVAVPIQQSGDVARRDRPAEQIALHFRAADFAHPGELLFRLDAFRQRGNAKARSKIGDRLHDRPAIPALAKFGNEGPVDLDLVEGKRAQIAQPGIAGAEIIHRNGDAERAQAAQSGEVGFAFRQKSGFRDLEFEPRRRQSRARERRENHLRQVAFLELNRREIYRDLTAVNLTFVPWVRPCRRWTIGTAFLYNPRDLAC